MVKNDRSDSSVERQYEIMTGSPVLRLILRLAVPAVISMLITNIYNLVDTAFVGQLGNSASGAVGVIFGFMSVIQAIGFMFGQGAGNIISSKLGHQDVEDASAIASTGFFCSLFFGLIVTAAGFIFLDPLVRVLGSTDTIAVYAKTYLVFILASAPLMTANFTLNNILRYEGKTLLGMIGLLIGAVMNICGDPILMFGLDMGIAGAGLSTACSQAVSFLILISMFFRKKTITKLFFPRMSIVRGVFWNIIITGLPSLLRQGLSSVTTVLLNTQAAFYGDEAVAAMSIVSRIIFLVLAVAMGIGQGFQPVSGFNYGAGKYGRVKKAYGCTMLLMEVVIAAAVTLVLVNASHLIQLFRDDADVILIGVRALRLQAVTLFAVPVCMSTEMLLQSTGKKAACAVLASMRSGIYFIPALLILAKIRGLYGIEEAQPVALVMAGASAIPFILWFFRKLNQEATEGE